MHPHQLEDCDKPLHESLPDLVMRPIRFSAIGFEPVWSRAVPFCLTQSRTQYRRSCESPCPAAPERDAFAPAWRVCRSGRRDGLLPGFQIVFVGAVASSESGALNFVLSFAPSFCRSCGQAAIRVFARTRPRTSRAKMAVQPPVSLTYLNPRR